MASVESLLAAVSSHLSTIRERHETHRHEQDITIMTLAEHLAAAVEKLAERLGAHDDMLAAAKKAEAAAETERDALKQQITDATTKIVDLEKKLAAELDPAPVQAVVDKIESITGPVMESSSTSTGTPPTAPVVTTDGSATIIVVPAASITPVTDPAMGTSVEPGTTAHSDTSTGVTTTVPHDGSAPTAVAASGAAVQPEPAVVQAAVAASAAAGVTMPAAS